MGIDPVQLYLLQAQYEMLDFKEKAMKRCGNRARWRVLTSLRSIDGFCDEHIGAAMESPFYVSHSPETADNMQCCAMVEDDDGVDEA